MGNAVNKYLCLQCIQYPGCLCCCADTCRYTRCGSSITRCANFWPCCLCLRAPIEKKILLLGMEGSGKTSLLYYLMFGTFFRGAEPTLGYNSEVVSFNEWQHFEVWEAGGDKTQRALWCKYYNAIEFDICVYLIDGLKWIKADESQKLHAFQEDRNMMAELINEEGLASTKIIIFLTFKGQTPNNVSEVVDAVLDSMDLEAHPRGKEVNIYTDLSDIEREFGIVTKDQFLDDFCCASAEGEYED